MLYQLARLCSASWSSPMTGWVCTVDAKERGRKWSLPNSTHYIDVSLGGPKKTTDEPASSVFSAILHTFPNPSVFLLAFFPFPRLSHLVLLTSSFFLSFNSSLSPFPSAPYFPLYHLFLTYSLFALAFLPFLYLLLCHLSLNHVFVLFRLSPRLC